MKLWQNLHCKYILSHKAMQYVHQMTDTIYRLDTFYNMLKYGSTREIFSLQRYILNIAWTKYTAYSRGLHFCIIRISMHINFTLVLLSVANANPFTVSSNLSIHSSNQQSIHASPVTQQSVKPIFLIHPLEFSCIHSLIIHPWTLLSIYPSTAHLKLVFSKTDQSYLLVVCNKVQSFVLTCIVWRLCCLISFGFLVSISKIYHLNENQISHFPASSHSEDVKWCLFDKDTGSSHIHSKFLCCWCYNDIDIWQLWDEFTLNYLHIIHTYKYHFTCLTTLGNHHFLLNA